MSGKVVGWAMEQRTGSPTTKLVLVKLADNANEDGLCWPSISLIVEHTELSVRSVREHLAKLEELSLVVIERRESEGVYLPSRFHLCVPWKKKAHEKRPGAGVGGSASGAVPRGVAHGGGAAAAGGDAGGALGVVQDVPPHIEEPSIEPPIEPSSEPQGASPPGGGLAPAQSPDLFGEQPQPPSAAEILEMAYQLYAAFAERAGWAAITKRSETRDTHMRARLKDCGGINPGGLNGWQSALEKAEASDFLCGRAPPSRPGRPPFKADFDFLTRESAFISLMEGKYDNGPSPQTPAGNLGIAARVAARRATERANGDSPS